MITRTIGDDRKGEPSISVGHRFRQGMSRVETRPFIHFYDLSNMNHKTGNLLQHLFTFGKTAIIACIVISETNSKYRKVREV